MLKRHKDKPWEWQELQCELAAHGQTDCKGTMDLKDVNLKMERGRLGPEAPQPFKFYLEKVYVCNECGHIYMAYESPTTTKPTIL